jgi:hypothetical protein
MNKQLLSPGNNSCVYLRVGKCIAKCDGMCPKLKYQSIVDEICFNPPKQPSPYLDIDAIRKEGMDKVLNKLEQLLCAHHKYVGSYRVITGTPEEIYDELFNAMQDLRAGE